MIDRINLKKMIDEKCISVQKHPVANLWIYNYTQKAQYDRVWNNETMQARGLIMDGQGSIAARPFPKFFNLDEALDKGETPPLEDFEIYDKMDDSLGILYHLNGKQFIATRGSFVSEQSQYATELLQRRYKDVFTNTQLTYLFEIIYPENRIVVDYGDTRDLYLLAVVWTDSGQEWPHRLVEETFGGIVPVVKRYDGVADFEKFIREQVPNSEGYVIRYASGKRYKVKFDEYVRLHRLVTGINARRIWDLLRNKQSFDDLLERVPDEFYQWVKNTVSDLKWQFDAIYVQTLKDYDEISKELQKLDGEVAEFAKWIRENRRKEFAILAQQRKHPGLLFAFVDEKPLEEMIWKLLKPKAERPFKEEI